MQKRWQKRFFPNPLQTFLVLVGVLWTCAAILAAIQSFPASPFVVMAVLCFGASWILAVAIRRPDAQNRLQG